MPARVVPFRLDRPIRDLKAVRFNDRAEVRWFGLAGRFGEDDEALVHLLRRDDGALGGGGTAALNGGLIAAGFDAAAVLAGLGHYDSDVIVTLDLSVRFLRLAHADEADEFAARVVKSTRSVAFIEGELRRAGAPGQVPFATLTAMVGPA